MSVTVTNTSDQRRVWSRLHTAKGAVLVLDPGEEAALAEDPGPVVHLRVKPPVKSKSEDTTGGK